MNSRRIKAIILAGGVGSRLSEETIKTPKPMIEIGNNPILWHILKGYSVHGINDFIICCGYRGNVIKEYFNNYFLQCSDVMFDFSKNSMTVHRSNVEDWRVTLVDTGVDSNTGGRLKRVLEYVQEDEFFHLTYGDGLANLDITALQEFHRSHKKLATVTAVPLSGRFGSLELDDDSTVTRFVEKPGSQINGGFFVLSPESIKSTIKNDYSVWELDSLPLLAADKQLAAFVHEGFWHPMDTLRDKYYLEDLWSSGSPPWKTW